MSMATNPQDPLTLANASRQVVDGIEYLTNTASLTFAKEIILEYKDLLEHLETIDD